MNNELSLLNDIKSKLSKLNIYPVNITQRNFPSEIIFIIEIYASSFKATLDIISNVDFGPNVIVTVKKVLDATNLDPKITSLMDPRITDLIELLTSRSRTSEVQPSLQYVTNVEEHLRLIRSQRHHLVFGRRGAGKTALMLEAKRLAEENGDVTCWVNIQSIRSLSAMNSFLTVASRICEIPETYFKGQGNKLTQSAKNAKECKESAINLTNSQSKDSQKIGILISQIQQMLHLFYQESQTNVFIFLDDFHYLNLNEQPLFLDLVHSLTRDTGAWIKVTSIKHQCRWFTDNPPTGLQIGHDAAVINLDITLEEPTNARSFLESVLVGYLEKIGVRSISRLIPANVIDRLVLGSGGVPRDFLLLCASALTVARQRNAPRTIGIQDINEAAGIAANSKLQELEDDAASSTGDAAQKKKVALDIVREWLINQKHTTFFRIDFKDKEKNVSEYDIIQSLMDLRFIHLIHSSVSDAHKAGNKSEVYALDLSQFSGSRLRRDLRVLDFSKGAFIIKKSGSSDVPKIGDTPKKLLGLLRQASLFELEQLKNV